MPSTKHNIRLAKKQASSQVVQVVKLILKQTPTKTKSDSSSRQQLEPSLLLQTVVVALVSDQFKLLDLIYRINNRSQRP